MKRVINLFLVCVSALTFSTAALASDFEKEIQGRQAYMNVLGYNMGILGAMARNKMPYDAELASATAKNLALAAAMNNSTMWPQGSDMDNASDTKTKAALWQDFPAVMGYLQDLNSSADALAAVAGDGAQAMGKALGAVGASCKGCHDDFQAK